MTSAEDDNQVYAFTPDQVCRLTGLSPRQLRYWDTTEFFTPTFRDEARRSAHARIYSFRDVVGLCTLAELRKLHRVPLQQLRRVAAHLRQRFREPWSTLTFYVVGKEVFSQDQREAAIRRADATGQQVMPLELRRVEGDVRRAIATLQQRPPELVGRVTRHRFVAQNQHVLAGTRVPTRAIWEFHCGGYSISAILREYPQLTPDDVRAALAFEQERRSGRRAG